MTLWTVMPPEAIFPAEHPEPAYEEAEFSGVKMLVEKISPEQCRIVRLLSTNPQDYLRSELQPGSTFSYQAKSIDTLRCLN